MIPYGRQFIDDADIDAVVETLKSDWLTQGPRVPQFEKTLASYCGAKFGVAVNSATSALHIACLALEVSEGDIVWTSPNSFVASANCAIYCGASIDFVDIDINSGNISVDALSDKLAIAKRQGNLPKVVIPVHFAGQPCDMKRIAELAHTYQFKVIEDASHAVGARCGNDPIGNCKYSDICVFSFHAHAICVVFLYFRCGALSQPKICFQYAASQLLFFRRQSRICFSNRRSLTTLKPTIESKNHYRLRP